MDRLKLSFSHILKLESASPFTELSLYQAFIKIPSVFLFLLVIGILPFHQAALAQVEIIEYSYDQGTHGKGRLSLVTEQKGTSLKGWTQFSYDVRGNVTQTDKAIEGASTPFILKSTYDSLDRVIDMTYPDGEVVRHSYNAQGQIEKLRSITYSLDYVVNLDYSPLNKVTAKTISIGATTKTTTYDYYDNAAKGTTSFRLRNISTPGLQNLTYTYDNVGNVTAITDTVKSATQIFSYDLLHRLDSASSVASPGYTHFYQYNAIGNMTAVAMPTPLINGASGNFRTEQVDVPAGDISIAADGVSSVHLSYIPFRFFPSDPVPPLKYIRRVGATWSAPEEIRGAENAWGGYGTSLALDGAGNPHIVYTAMVPKGDGTFLSGLRYATRSSSNGEWSIQPVGSGNGYRGSIKISSNGTVHIAYIDSGIKYARLSGGVWTVEPVGTDFFVTAPDLALTPSGDPRIIFNGSPNATPQKPRYAFKNGTSPWTVHNIPEVDAPLWLYSLDIDNASVPHIAYWKFNWTSQFLSELNYLKLGQTPQLLRIASPSSTDIDVDDQGYPILVYTGVFDTTRYPGPQRRVEYARFNGTSWVFQSIDPTGGGNEAAVVALIDGHAHVGYNGSTGELKYAASFGKQAIAYPSPKSPRPHAPTGYGSFIYAYDANGNRTSANGPALTRTYTWDFDNRLTKVQQNGVTLTEFAYDYAGQRVKKTAGGNTTLYIGKHYECTNNVCSKFIFANGERIALRPVGTNEVYYYFADHFRIDHGFHRSTWQPAAGVGLLSIWRNQAEERLDRCAS